jgi:hypothetical protein
MLGSGPNFQHACHRGVYVGVNDKFNEFIQSVHRIHRYQQKHRVRIDVIHAQSQIAIVRRMLADWKRHDETTERTSDLIRRHGLSPSERSRRCPDRSASRDGQRRESHAEHTATSQRSSDAPRLAVGDQQRHRRRDGRDAKAARRSD